MNILPSESVKFIEELEKVRTTNEIIILAPYIDLPYLRSDKIKFGSQNIYYKDKGSYTGEISSLMIKDIGIYYTLIGHYERRLHFNETDKIVNLKVRNSINNGINVILCVNSIDSLMEDIIGISDYEKLIIAYEPDDFIGGSTIISNENIKKFIKSARELTSDNVKIIYGGGINKNNVNNLKEIDELDGILVGSNSTSAYKFKEIIEKYN